ncbi:hypothetical protein DNTS_021336, partial [Danionella cerebrum]
TSPKQARVDGASPAAPGSQSERMLNPGSPSVMCAAGRRAGERLKMWMSLWKEMSGSRELSADWKESERDGGGGKSLSSAGTGAPVPWTGGAVLANIQPSPCSTTTSTLKRRQVRPNQRLSTVGRVERTSRLWFATGELGDLAVWCPMSKPVTHDDPWLWFPLSTKTESRSRSVVSWSVHRQLPMPFAQNAPSSSCSTSQYPLVR